jgi:hypothetical protein
VLLTDDAGELLTLDASDGRADAVAGVLEVEAALGYI